MTYADAITRVNEKVRESEAWPSDTSKEAEQLHILYNAGLAVLKSIPMERLTVTDSGAITGTSTGRPGVSSFDFPSTLFKLRPDLGIANYVLDSVVYLPMELVPAKTLLSLGGNRMHKDRVLFSIDREADLFYAQNVTSMVLRHVEKPAYPTDTTDDYMFPTKDNDYELALSLVASHVSVETVPDGAKAQAQQFLALLYGDDTNQVSLADEE
jgi:hypothetical protein